jgi:putative spermidine/putrescine transport system substrate-binding protein
VARRSSQHWISRRALVQASAALTVTATAPFVLRSARAQNAAGEVVFGCNGGSTQSIFEKVIIPKFTQATGIKVSYVPGQPADLVAKLRAQRQNSGLDVVWLAGAVTYVAIDEGLLLPYDPSLVPNASKIDPKIAREKAILPIAISGNALIYNKKVFDQKGWGAPSSWFDLWDTRLKGHTGMYGMSSTGGVEMLLQVAKELTGDYNNLEPAFEKFKQLRSNIYEFFPSAGAWETALQQGDLWLAVNSYTRAIQLTQAGQPIGTVLPKSGIPSHELSTGIVQGSKNAAAAHAWSNFLLSSEAQELIAKNLGYSPSITGVQIPDELKPFYPDPQLVWFPDWRSVSKRFDEIVNKWQRTVER